MALGKSNWLALQLKFSLLGNGEKASSFQDQAYYKKPATWDWLWNCSWPSFCSAAAAAALPFQHGLLHSPYLLGVKIQGCVHACVRWLLLLTTMSLYPWLTPANSTTCLYMSFPWYSFTVENVNFPCLLFAFHYTLSVTTFGARAVFLKLLLSALQNEFVVQQLACMHPFHYV